MTMPAGLRVPNRQEVESMRDAFSRQSVRAIVIDAAVTSDGGGIEDLAESMKQLFAVICSFRGPPRIPGVSVLTSNSKADILLPMQKITKPLYGRFLSSLVQTPVTPVMQCTDEFRQTSASLEQVLVLAISDFRKFKELSGFHDQLEISVFSSRSSHFLRSFASATIHNLNSDEVKGIEFISIARCSERLLSQSPCDQDLLCQNLPGSGEQSEFGCLWNIVQVEPNAVSIQCHMRHWFKDECSDKEHFCLSIKDVQIKCDMQQRCVNPNAFSFKHFYALGEQGTARNAGSRPLQNKPEAIRILQMRATAMIDQDGICDSLVFGTPVVLVSSSCWRMEWDELDCNQDRFTALCRTLLDQRRCLLCEDTTQHQNRHGNYSKSHSVQPRGLFILFPSNSSSMLMKAIVPRELLLPTETDSLSAKTNFSSSAVEDVQSAVDSLEKINIYNPLDHPCGLYESLHAILLPKSSTKFSRSVNTA